jgi:replicative DNA helicase
VKISRWSRHPDAPDKEASQRDAAARERRDRADPANWRLTSATAPEAAPEQEDSFVPSGALAFAFDGDTDDMGSGDADPRMRMGLSPAPVQAPRVDAAGFEDASSAEDSGPAFDLSQLGDPDDPGLPGDAAAGIHMPNEDRDPEFAPFQAAAMLQSLVPQAPPVEDAHGPRTAPFALRDAASVPTPSLAPRLSSAPPAAAFASQFVQGAPAAPLAAAYADPAGSAGPGAFPAGSAGPGAFPAGSAGPGAAATAPSAPAPVAPAPVAPERPSAPANGQDKTWTVDTGLALVQPRSASEVLSTLAGKVSAGAVDQYQPVPLGFTPLDKTIGGGLRAGELLLIGGAQGTGKTTMAVQMARNIVLGGQASVLYICFEHDEEYLLNRIIAMESVLSQLPAKTGGVKLQDVRREILGTWLAQGGEHADLSSNPRLKPALDRLGRYGLNLYLLRGSQTTSTVENMRALVQRYKQLSGDRRLVVFVDYMQKVPVIPEPNTETEKVTSIVNGLKDVALSLDVPMISIVAADKEGLKAARLRNHHLRGSSAINYEADIILILNEKYNIVAKVNIEFNPYQAQRFREWVVLSVEKNRGGQHSVDLEFQKHFEFSCFDANGRTVQEKLIEERLYND